VALGLADDDVLKALEPLQGMDRARRGHALEYLETVLPRAVRERLIPWLEQQPASGRPGP
jgi:hypothetical protein